MRSSNKQRSRNKNNNRNRNVGNVVNRVFDSAGPEGKVRGTPQQIIEKYQMLARDAQLSGDRVAAENFMQHAEHYLRLLGEAQREMAERQAEHQQRQQQGGQRQDDDEDDDDGSDQADGDTQPFVQHRPQRQRSHEPSPMTAPEDDQDEDSGLVETPESRANGSSEIADQPHVAPAQQGQPGPRKPRGRRPRQPAPVEGADNVAGGASGD